MAGTLPQLSDAYRRDDPAPSWLWVCDITIPNYGPLDSIYIEGHTYPFSNLSPDQRFAGGRFIRYPKTIDTEEASVLFYETQTYTMQNLITYWRNLVCDDDGNFGLPIDYLGLIELSLFPYGGGSPTFVGQLYDVWPVSQQSFQLEYGNSSHLGLMVNFSVNGSKVLLSGATNNSLPFA